MTEPIHFNQANRRSILLLAFVWLLAFGLNLAVCPGSDDLNYMHVFEVKEGLSAYENKCRFVDCIGRPVSTPGDVVESVRNHYLYFGNARLANDMAFAFNLFPNWLADFVSASMFVVLIVMISLFGFGRKLSPMRIMTTVVCSALFLTWSGRMLLCDYLMNYLWAGAITLGWLWLLIRRKSVSLWLMIPLSFVAGGMHEVFSVSFGLSALVMTVMDRRLHNRKVIVPLAVFFSAAFAIIFSPSLLSRMEMSGVGTFSHTVSFGILAHGLLNYAAPIVILLVLLLLAVRSSGDVRRRLTNSTVPFVAAILGNFAIFMATFNVTGRVAWPANIAAIIILMRIIGALGVRPARWMRISLRAGMVLWVMFVGVITVAQAKLNLKMQDFRRVISESEGKSIVYFDEPADWSMPFFVSEYLDTHSHHVMQEALSNRTGLLKPVVATKYCGMPLDSIPLIPGTARLRGQYPWFVTDAGHCSEYLVITFGPKREDASALQLVPFAREIISVLHGKRIIDPNQALTMVFQSSPIPSRPGWASVKCLSYPTLYNGRQIVRIDSISCPL